jgi:hypothetical protein
MVCEVLGVGSRKPRARNPNTFFILILLCRGTPSAIRYPRVAIAPPIRTFFSLTRVVEVDTRHTVYLRHAAVFVLADGSAASTWRASGGDICSGRWYELLVNYRRWGLVLGHCRAMLLVISTGTASRSTVGVVSCEASRRLWGSTTNALTSWAGGPSTCRLVGSTQWNPRSKHIALRCHTRGTCDLHRAGVVQRSTPNNPRQRATEKIGGCARKPEARSTREARRIPSRLWEYSARP